MFFVFIFYFAIGNFILYRPDSAYFAQGRKIFNYTFGVFLIYLLWTHSLIENPAQYYLGNSDEAWIYNETLDLIKYSIPQLPEQAFSFAYIELPISMLYFALMAKLSLFLGIGDFCLFIKASHIFFGSLIPAFVYLTSQSLFPTQIKAKTFVLFAILTPIMFNACQLARDIHVVFLFTLMLYVVFSGGKFKYLWLIILAAINIGVRFETGLFSLLILFFPIASHLRKIPRVARYLLYILLFIVGLYVLPMLSDTTSSLINYHDSGLEDADSGSLGVKLASLPFPINIIGTFAFGQIQPFPVWMAFVKSNANAMEFPLALLCLIPLYWMPVVGLTYYILVKKWKSIDINVKLLSIVALLFLFMVSYGQQLPRRLMSVYPFIFIAYIWMNNCFNLEVLRRRFGVYSVIVYAFLHIIYMMIK